MAGGSDPETFSRFYAKLTDIKDYHRKFPDLAPYRPEAESMLREMSDSTKPPVDFSGEEGFGRYLDLHAIYNKWVNLKGVKQTVYVEYIQTFMKFSDGAERNQAYVEYLKELFAYLVDFFKRAMPLYHLQSTLDHFGAEFETQWNEKKYVPVSVQVANQENGVDKMHVDKSNGIANGTTGRSAVVLPWQRNYQLPDGKFYCVACNKTLAKETVFKAHVTSPKHLKTLEKYDALVKEIAGLETKINKMGDLLFETILATKDHIENKQARRADEESDEEEDAGDIDVGETEVEEIRVGKLNYPVDAAGQPIPYWLYKLHGLGIEYKCEICGNTSYWGRRAFERHFWETRHVHGLKCLRIDMQKEFSEVTKIQDAMDLAKKLLTDKAIARARQDAVEEFESEDGAVLDRKTFDLLARQNM